MGVTRLDFASDLFRLGKCALGVLNAQWAVTGHDRRCHDGG